MNLATVFERKVDECFEQVPSAGALLDRLTHHVHILAMNGDSYRLKQSAGRRADAPNRAEQNQAITET